MTDARTHADTRHRLATDYVAGLVDHDFDRMRSALSDDATWSIPGDTAISGVADGGDAVVERARAITAGGDVDISLQHVLLGWEHVAVLLHNTGRRGETVLDEQVVIMFTVRDDLIVAAQNLISDVPGLDAFFAAGQGEGAR